MDRWHPTRCALQLSLGGGAGALSSGDVYSGTATIRYARRGPTASPTLDTLNTLNTVDVLNAGALHFHAITAPTRALPKIYPLVLHSIKVHQEQQGDGVRLLKVLKVVDDDDSDGGGGEGERQRRGASTVKSDGRKAPKNRHGGGKDKQGEEGSCNADEKRQDAEVGSKHVFFEGGETMPVGSTVVLTITFTGRIQEWDQGGIYTTDNSKAGTATGGVLLTHFEVVLARLAFPCPDDAQRYRLIWQLQSLELPSIYKTVVSNAAKISEKQMGKRGVQHAFQPVGPLPAYLFAFAAFADAVNVVEETLYLRDFSSTASDRRNRTQDDARIAVPLRVIASEMSGVTSVTLRKIADIVQEAVPLLEDFFDSPLPLQAFSFPKEFGRQEEMLTIVVAPTMPYISGMEHHGCIFLNEAIYQSSTPGAGGAKGSSRHHTAGTNKTDETSRVDLIVHELAHHWMGNALGLPFVLKEGVCLLLERHIGDVILGKPMRKTNPCENTADSLSVATSSGAAATSVVVVQTEKGKEFTGNSYQKALNTLRDVVSGMGFAAFKRRMRHMYSTEVMGRDGNCDMMGENSYDDVDWSEGVLLAPYVTTDQFLAYMNA